MDPMAANRSKPADTGNTQVFALQTARDWLAREGGRQRIATVLGALLDATVVAVSRGEPPPEKDSMTLTDIWRQSREGSSTGSGSPLRGAEIQQWWQARANHLRQVCSAHSCEWIPRLVVKPGGGRGLPTQFQFALDPSEAGAEPTDDVAEPAEVGALRYQISPAKPALWLRWMLGGAPFPMRSWRGYLLVGTVLLDIFLIAAIWIGIYLSWAHPRPVTTADLAMVLSAVFVTTGLWALARPIWLLPQDRVTLAGPAFLALSELYGQLRTMPDGTRREAGRVFSVVRHWGTCPVCAAEVDIQEGGREFPGRLVGRCHDAPLEHAYSFDPVRLVGRPLRGGV